MLHGYFALFLIIALGLIVGNLKFKGISLELSAVIFVALVLGHFGFTVPDDVNEIGVLLFIFTIGIQAGPGFFDSFKKRGIQLILTASGLVTSAALFTLLFAHLLKIDFKLAVGIFTGALTSTPGLAAAIESSRSPLASIGYGISYPFGVIGVIIFVRLLPKLARTNLTQASLDYERDSKSDFPEISNQNFIVENLNLHDKTIGELNIRSMTGATISRVLHDNFAVTPTAKTKLYLGDLLKAVGTEKALNKLRFLIGKPVEQEIPLSRGYDIQWVLVTNKQVVNQTLAQLNLLANYNATVTRIRRSGIDIAPNPQSHIRFGDKLMIASDKENMTQVIQLLGNNDKRLSETDFLPIALGIVLGVLLGKMQIPLWGGAQFSLGLTGGVLAVALILSRIGKTGPVIWTLSGSANQLLRTMGLLFFLASVGTEAGAHMSQTFIQYGAKLFFAGALITIFPMIVATLIAIYAYRMNFLTLLGTLAGGMTSTPALAAIDPMTECNAPQIAYATVYPVALVLMILFSQIIGRLG